MSIRRAVIILTASAIGTFFAVVAYQELRPGAREARIHAWMAGPVNTTQQ